MMQNAVPRGMPPCSLVPRDTPGYDAMPQGTALFAAPPGECGENWYNLRCNGFNLVKI